MADGELQDLAHSARFHMNKVKEAFRLAIRRAYGDAVMEHLSDEELTGLQEVYSPHMSFQAMKGVEAEYTEAEYEKDTE